MSEYHKIKILNYTGTNSRKIIKTLEKTRKSYVEAKPQTTSRGKRQAFLLAPQEGTSKHKELKCERSKSDFTTQ